MIPQWNPPDRSETATLDFDEDSGNFSTNLWMIWSLKSCYGELQPKSRLKNANSDVLLFW